MSLALEDSQKLFLLIGNWDVTRSLLAQRTYVGDDVMNELWYPTNFLDAVQLKRDEVRSQLEELQKHYKWPGGELPSGAWIAEKAGQTWEVTLPLMEAAAISSDESLGSVDMEPVLSRLLALGKVPLAHAHEWNLTSEGPLSLR